MLLFVFRHITNVRTGEIKSEGHNAIGARREVDTAESARRETYEASSVRIIARRGTYIYGVMYTGLFTMSRGDPAAGETVSWLAESKDGGRGGAEDASAQHPDGRAPG